MALMMACLVAWAAAASSELVAPVPLTPAQIPIPREALAAPRVVRASIEVNVHGEVQRVQLLEGPAGVWGSAVLEAAAGFRFKPALSDGEPVAAGIVFTQTFLPRPAQDEPATLEILVVEKGTRRNLLGAIISANADSEETAVSSDALGHATLHLPPGKARVQVRLAGYRPFTVQEELHTGDLLKVRYLLERVSYDAYETIVVGKQQRTELTRTSLSGSEIYQVPGTFGDPFRVVTTLPGVGTILSFLGYAVVRGTSPSSTAFMVDGIPVPLLFHFVAGPSVLHPNFIDRIDFYPGNFPVEYGGYTGGIVDGITRRAGADEKKIEVDVDLLQAGAFLRGPVAGGFTATVAGRYGYPGLLLKAVQVPVTLQYWDYQARVDGPLGGGRLKIFAFGAADSLGVKQPDNTYEAGVKRPDKTISLGLQFHRLDLGWQREESALYQSYGLVFGFDKTNLLAITEGVNLQALSVTPRARWRLGLGDTLTLRLGAEAGFTAYRGGNTVVRDNANQHLQSATVLADLPWWPRKDLQVVLGMRVDQYANQTVNHLGYNPRLGVRWRALDLERTMEHGLETNQALWLKFGVGHFNQPPRLLIPLPGLEASALQQGLTSSSQAMLGSEVPVPGVGYLDAQVYYNDMDRLIYDTSINADPSEQLAAASDVLGILAGSQQPKAGRSFGLEILLKRPNEGAFFGWVSYTASRSERCHGGGTGPLCRGGKFVPFDYDRTHMVQLVGGWRLPRGWQLGGRLQFASGRPLTGPRGYNTSLAPAFYRLDVRVDRRVVYNQFLFNFYVDIINTTLSPEYSVGASSALPYFLPTLGVRAEI